MKKQFRTIIREHVFKMTYQYELLGDNYNDIPNTYWLSEEEKNKNVVKEANQLFLNIAKNKDLLDSLYKDKLKDGWTFERIGIVEKCILRAALYELLNTKTPIYTINNDYGQIAKKYIDDKVPAFIRGIIAAVEEEEKVGNK